MASSPKSYTDKPYTDRFVLSRWFNFWRHKQRISGYPDGQGVFSGHSLIPGTREARELGNGDEMVMTNAFITFLSKHHADKYWCYRASVSTVESEALSMIEDSIEAKFIALLEKEGLSWEDIFANAGVSEDLINPELSRIPGVLGKDGSVSIWGYHLAELRKVSRADWEALPIQVGAKVGAPHTDAHGIKVVLDVDNLTRDVLVSFVRRFWSGRERDFHEPVDWTGREEVMKMLLEEGIEGMALMDAEARAEGIAF